MKRGTPWTTEEDDALRKGIADGKPYAVIGAPMDRSREAVSSRAQKLGLRSKAKPFAGKAKGVKTINKIDGRPPEIHQAYGMPKLMVELEAQDCRWPCEGTSWYCGAPNNGGPYCVRHAAVAYLKEKKRG